jgi:neutral ceramidase
MDPFQDLKAGPSEDQPRLAPDSSKLRRFIKLGCIAIALLLACAVFTEKSFYGRKQGWIWRLHEEYGSSENHQKHSNGSLYLLGVGKADITG